jgi:hypothetical protein
MNKAPSFGNRPVISKYFTSNMERLTEESPKRPVFSPYFKEERAKAYRKEYRQVQRNNPLQKYKEYESSAKIRSKPFQLSFQQATVLFSGLCYYCGADPEKTRELNGIDRKNNEVGYTSDNSTSCCTRCNYAKGTLTVEEFLEMCHKVSRNHTFGK